MLHYYLVITLWIRFGVGAVSVESRSHWEHAAYYCVPALIAPQSGSPKPVSNGLENLHMLVYLLVLYITSKASKANLI